MATLAELMAASGLESSQKAPDLGGAVAKGAELGIHMQKVAQDRAVLEQQKKEAVTQKWSVVGNMYDRWEKMPDGPAKNNIGQKVIPAMLNSFNLSEEMNPAVAEILAKDPTIGAFLNAKTRDGSIKFPDMITATKQPDTFLQFITDNGLAKYGDEKLIKSTIESSLPTLQEAYAKRVESGEVDARNERTAQASMAKQIQGQGAAPEVEEKKKISDLWVAYKASGGQAGTRSRISKLKEIKGKLERNEIKFGGVLKNIPYGSNIDVLARLDPKAKAAVDTVRSSINVKMRTGDPNPTQNQIDQIYNQAIDTRLDNPENIKKLEKEIAAEEEADRNAQNMFTAAGKMSPSTGSKTKGGPQEGDTKTWQGQTFKVINGNWVKQ